MKKHLPYLIIILIICGGLTRTYTGILTLTATNVKIGTTTADSVLTVTGGGHFTRGLLLGGDFKLYIEKKPE